MRRGSWRWRRTVLVVLASVGATAFVGVSIVIATIAGNPPAHGPQAAAMPYGLAATPAPRKRWVARKLAGSPPALATLHRQGGRLIAGDLQAHLKALRGRPIVLNAWASWCGACRAELPLMARAAARFGRRVAFLGADVDDSAGAAGAMLQGEHLSYPSFHVSADELRSLAPVAGFPTTIFIDRRGQLLSVHPGQYPGARALSADVRRYAAG